MPRSAQPSVPGSWRGVAFLVLAATFIAGGPAAGAPLAGEALSVDVLWPPPALDDGTGTVGYSTRLHAHGTTWPSGSHAIVGVTVTLARSDGKGAAIEQAVRGLEHWSSDLQLEGLPAGLYALTVRAVQDDKLGIEEQREIRIVDPPSSNSAPRVDRVWPEEGSGDRVLRVVASDPDGGPLHYWIERGPAAVHLDPASGRLWTDGVWDQRGDVLIGVEDPAGATTFFGYQLVAPAARVVPATPMGNDERQGESVRPVTGPLQQPPGAGSRTTSAELPVAALGPLVGATLILTATLLASWAGRLIAAALTARIRGRRALESEQRRRILALVEVHPGLTTAELASRTGIRRRTLQWHLDLLAREGCTVSAVDGKVRRWGPAGRTIALPHLTVIQHTIGHRLVNNPGSRTAELAATLGCTRQNVSYHLHRLEERGLVEATGPGGREPRYAATPELVRTVVARYPAWWQEPLPRTEPWS